MKDTPMLYSGIDIANKTFVASALRTIPDYLIDAKTYDNTLNGFRRYYKDLTAIAETHESVLCCMEHTGVYTEHLCHYLHKKADVKVWVEPSQHVKRAFKLKKKNDQVDSRQITQYAKRYEDEFRAWHPPDPVVIKIGALLAQREMIKRQQVEHKNAMTSYKKKVECVDVSYNADIIDFLNEQESRLETALKETLKENPRIYAHAKNLMSIKCIKLYCTCNFLLLTRGFERHDYKNLASLIGIAPREWESGTSVKGKEETDHYGPSSMRKALHLAAKLSCHHTPKYKAYYQKLSAKGKHPQLIYNNVKYRLLKTMCAIIRDGMPYESEHRPVRPDISL